MDKLNKLSLPIVILIASLVIGGFYYASEVNKQKSIERQQQIKIEQEKQDKLAEQEAKDEAKQALDTCIADAEKSYSDNWFRECKSQGLLTDRCIDLNDMTFDEYAEQNNIPQDKKFEAIDDFYKEKGDCSCRLILANADRLNEGLEKDKEVCFKKYPQQ